MNSRLASTFVTGISEAAFEVSAVPIPATGWLLGTGCAAFLRLARRRKAA